MYRIHTQSDHSLDKLFMVLLIQLLHHNQLPFCIGNAGRQLYDAIREFLQMSLSIV